MSMDVIYLGVWLLLTKLRAFCKLPTRYLAIVVQQLF